MEHPATIPAVDEVRELRRRKVFLAGAVAQSEQGQDRALCFVHDLTETGAQLELAGLARFQGTVQVYLPSLERALPAQVVWQQSQRLGLRFLQPLAQDQLRKSNGPAEA